MNKIEQVQIEKLLDCLGNAGLSEEQIDMAETYFLGESEMPDYKITAVKDADQIVDTKKRYVVQQYLSEVIRGRRQEEFFKLFQIFFQIYGVSSYILFPRSVFCDVNLETEYTKCLPTPQLLAFVAIANTQNYYYVNLDTYKTIMELAQEDKQSMKAAYELLEEPYFRAKILLLTAYFYSKRDEAELAAEDIKLLDVCADLYVNYLDDFFENGLRDAHKHMMTAYIEQEENMPISEQLGNILQQNNISRGTIELFIGGALFNYKRSYKLQNFLKLCVYKSHLEESMRTFRKANRHMEGKLNDAVLVWQKDFDIDTKLFIWCLAVHDLKPALAQMAETRSEEYRKAIDEANINIYDTMVEALKAVPEAIYETTYKEVVENVAGHKRKMIAEELIKNDGKQDAAVKDAFRQFLLANGSVEALYEHAQQLQADRYAYYQDNCILNHLNRYVGQYGNDDFAKRCKTYICVKLACKGSISYYDLISSEIIWEKKKERYAKEDVLNFFQELQELGVHKDTQIWIAMAMCNCVYKDTLKDSLLEAYFEIFNGYLQADEETMLPLFNADWPNARYLGVYVFGRNGEKYKENLFGYFRDKAQYVRDLLCDIMVKHEDWAPEVLEQLKGKTAAQRELAAKILGRMQGDYKEALIAALEVEKTKKVSDFIANLLQSMGTEADIQAKDANTLVTDLHRGGRKRSVLWAYESPFPAVHFTGEQSELEADEKYMQAILIGYLDATAPGLQRQVSVLTDQLNKAELAIFMNELYDRWIEAGAEAKKKWVLYITAIYGGADIVTKLKRQIDDWAKHSRGVIAGEAVKSLALNDSPTALLVVDSIARKYKYKQVKTAASQALSFAAKELGISIEELADKIVPDLGFNENRERIFDYGQRTFKVYITPSLEIEVVDDKGKRLKNMPSPGKKDDEAKASVAYAEFKEMKKQMKTAVANQKLRLELALTINRKWKADNWNKLFVGNPIMHQFAISLIWGVYEEGELKDTFRYMEDGTFNTVDEEEYELAQDAQIGLVHPIELSEDLKKEWLEQLSDYEITQSIEQLNRPVYTVTEEEKKEKSLNRFGGKVLNALSICSKMATLGWSKGPAMDAGIFYWFERVDKECNLAAELYFSGAYSGYDQDDVTVYDVVFYEPGKGNRNGKVWGRITPESAMALEDVPARYYSEMLYQIEKATAGSTKTNENWMGERI